MNAVVVLDNPARTVDSGTNHDLFYMVNYFKFVIVVIFKDEGCGTSFMNQVKFILTGYGEHLDY